MRPTASSSLSRFSQSLACWSRRTWFRTCAVLVWSCVQRSRVFGSSFALVIISWDLAKLSLSCWTIWARISSSLGPSVLPICQLALGDVGRIHGDLGCGFLKSSRGSPGWRVQCLLPEPERSHADTPEQSYLGLVEGSVFASLFQLVEDDAG